jgi:1-acyl-sn-glycerol-3-phosphate acyltransferase
MPLSGPVIIAANHESYLDPPFVGSSFNRPINYLARETLFSNWLSGPFLSALNAVPVDRGGGGAKGLKIILERLMDNNAIIIFPEGTRTSDGKMKSAQAGIGLTIIKSRAPVVPVRLWTYNTYGRHRRIPRLAPIAVKFGHPIHFHSLREKAATCPRPELRNLYQQATDETMTAIATMRPVMDRA